MTKKGIETVKAVCLKAFGEIENLYIGEISSPTLSPYSVRIRVKAAGVNRADISQRQGSYPPPPGESEILGLEVSGEVIETTSDKFKIGDRVMALLAGGGYAEEVVVAEDFVLVLPGDRSFEEGAAFVETFVTAYLNLFLLAKIQPQETALIHAGASGVGLSALQLLKHFGIKAYATVGSLKKKVAVEKFGATGLLYKEKNWYEAVSSIDVILDPVATSYVDAHFRLLNADGRWVVIGLMGGLKTEIDFSRLLMKRIKLMGSTLRGLPKPRKAEVMRQFEKEIYPLFVSGKISPVIDEVFSIEKVQAAHRKMESNENIGKLVLSF